MIDDFAKVLSNSFTTIEDDGWLIDNGYMKPYLNEETIKYGGDYLYYEILKPFVFNDTGVNVGTYIAINPLGDFYVL